VLSLLEIFYFITFRLYFNWRNTHQSANRYKAKVSKEIMNPKIWHSKSNPGIVFDWKFTEYKVQSCCNDTENSLLSGMVYDKSNSIDKPPMQIPLGLQL